MAVVSFDRIPASNLVAPIIAFEVGSGGNYTGEASIVLLGHANTGASIAPNTRFRLNNVRDAVEFAGKGSMLADMVRIARMNDRSTPIYGIAVPATGVAEVRTLTLGAMPADGGQFVVMIGGEPVSITIAAGDTAATVATAFAAAVNAYYNRLTEAYLPWTATAASGVVTLTARHAGAIFKDYDISVPTLDGGNAATSTNVTIAVSTAGTGSPDTSAAMAAIADLNADVTIAPWSDVTNLDRYRTAFNDVSGRWAWDRQSYGHIWSHATGTSSANAGLAEARNDPHLTLIERISNTGDYNPAWQWVTAVATRVTSWLTDFASGNVSRNQTGLVVYGLSAPRNVSAVSLYANRNASLLSGLSSWKVNAGGEVVIDKLITTYRKNSQDVLDETFRDVQAMYQVMLINRFFKAELSYKHSQKALADENPGGNQNISTPRDIKATFVHAGEELARRAVLENIDEFARSLIVVRDPASANRVNAFLPVDRVNPLDVFANRVVLYSQYRGDLQQLPIAA